LISKYSPSQLKYEKRIAVSYNKETFYSYMHDIEYVNLKFVIITDSVSFIPDNITHRCQIIHFKRPTMSAYNKCLFVVKPPTELVPEICIDYLKSATENIIVKSAGGTAASLYKPLPLPVPVPSTSVPGLGLGPGPVFASQTHSNDIFQVIKKSPVRITSEFELHNITNIKSLKANITELMVPHENICNQIIEIIKTPTIHLKFDVLRDLLYDLLIYDIDIQECIWFILEKLIQDGLLRREYMDDIMIKMFTFLQYFNNNYRPIYHLENFVLILICKIHGYKHIHPDVKK